MDDDFDRQYRQLLDEEAAGIRLDRHGAPLDPAQTMRHDREMAFKLDDRRRETMRLAAMEREAIETHWDRWERIQDRQDATRASGAAAPQWQAQQVPQVHVHLNLGQLTQAPAWQPVPTYAPPCPLYDEAKIRNEDRGILIGIVTCSILALAMIWMLASVARYQGQQDALEQQQYSTSTTAAP